MLEHKNDPASGIPQILATTELWFIPVVNPDGYDYTFVSDSTRLWRKSLRDNNGDGAITTVDGVDPNRNWPTKWRFDPEGASDNPASETYRGPSPSSEPEVTAYRALMNRLKAKFMIDYHSFGELILYPEGWQVETRATDDPLMEALAGRDESNPAIPGYDPDLSAELYTVNGDITDDALAGRRHAGLHRGADRRLRPGGRRHRRHAPQPRPGRLRLPGLRGRGRDRLPGEPPVRPGPRALRARPRRPEVAHRQRGGRLRAERVRRSRTAIRSGSRSTPRRRSAR